MPGQRRIRLSCRCCRGGEKLGSQPRHVCKVPLSGKFDKPRPRLHLQGTMVGAGNPPCYRGRCIPPNAHCGRAPTRQTDGCSLGRALLSHQRPGRARAQFRGAAAVVTLSSERRQTCFSSCSILVQNSGEPGAVQVSSFGARRRVESVPCRPSSTESRRPSPAAHPCLRGLA